MRTLCLITTLFALLFLCSCEIEETILHEEEISELESLQEAEFRKANESGPCKFEFEFEPWLLTPTNLHTLNNFVEAIENAGLYVRCGNQLVTHQIDAEVNIVDGMLVLELMGLCKDGSPPDCDVVSITTANIPNGPGFGCHYHFFSGSVILNESYYTIFTGFTAFPIQELIGVLQCEG